MTELTMFAAAFATVFLLGIQQQNVHGRHYWAAGITSLCIGASQFVLWRIAPTATVTEIAATLAGGPVGIMAAMVVHPRLARRWRRAP